MNGLGRNILISGASGFIGKAICRRLLLEGFGITVVTRNSKSDLSKEVKTMSLVELNQVLIDGNGTSFDGIIHLASYFVANHSADELDNIVDSNILLGIKLLEYAKAFDVKWFINTGTFWQNFEAKEYCPVNLYASSKEAFQCIMKYYTETSETVCVTLKLSDTYGPGDPRKKVFTLWLETLSSGEELRMSPGLQEVGFSHIDNVVETYLRLIELLYSNKIQSGGEYAISPDAILELKDLASLFEQLINKKMNIVWGGRPYRDREVMKVWRGGQEVPGVRKRVTLIEGLSNFLCNVKKEY